MDEATTQMVEIDKIRVEEGFNPRTDFDEGSLSELEASIRQSGLVTALTVRANGEGFILIAGQRRLIAAKRAGLKAVPVLIREGSDGLAAAVAENLIRSDLDPIEEANALARLAEVEKLATHKQLAERVGKSSAYVSQRLRLLALPEAAQVQIAAGSVPVAAERELRKVAKVSPAVAEGAAKLVARGEIEGRDLIERFDEVLQAVAESEMPGGPTMIDVARGAARVSELINDSEQQASLTARLLTAQPYDNGGDPFIRFSEAELDAARAAGCLLEHQVDHGGWSTSLAYICDAEFAADLAQRAIERIEKDAKRRAKQGGLVDGVGTNGGDPASGAEQAAEERRVGREEAKRDAERARTFNLELGRKLIGRRAAATRKEHSLSRAKALAEIVLADNPNLAARGLRLVLPQLQEVETKTLKSGEARETVTYKEAAECDSYLRNRIAEAKRADEVYELLADALIAALQADERELPASRRISWWHSAQQEVAKALAAEIKSIRPSGRGRRG